MKNILLIAILLTAFTGLNAQTIKDNNLSLKEVKSQLSEKHDFDLKLYSVSMQMWPERKLKDNTLGRFLFDINQTTKEGEAAHNLPYAFMAVYNAKGELIGESSHSYGMFYSEQGRDVVEIILPKDTNFEEAEIFILSGFKKSAVAYPVVK